MSNIVFKPLSGNDIVHGGVVSLSPAGITGAEKVGTKYTLEESTVSNLPTTGDIAAKYLYEFSSEVPRYAPINATGGTNTLIAAIPNKSIEVSSYTFLSDTAVEVTILSDTTVLASGMQFLSQGGVSADSADGLFKTNVGEALKMTLASGSVDGHLTYKVK